MPVSESYLGYVLDQLAGLGEVRARRMFGGVGLYHDELFFALIDDDTLFLKVDDGNRAEFVARGMAPFQPFKDRPEFSMSYFETPADVIEDAELFAVWSRGALRAAAATPRKAKAAKRASARPAKSSGTRVTKPVRARAATRPGAGRPAKKR